MREDQSTNFPPLPKLFQSEDTPIPEVCIIQPGEDLMPTEKKKPRPDPANQGLSSLLGDAYIVKVNQLSLDLNLNWQNLRLKITGSLTLLV